MLISAAAGLDDLAWDKAGGLLPAIVQHAFDGRVLMQAFMNREALQRTLETGQVTLWSRARERLWTKGETSGNTLALAAVHADCDRDCLLVLAYPDGPTCHRGTDTCFDGDAAAGPGLAFLAELERLIGQRDRERPEGSYTARLLQQGTRRIAQKLGEEGVEAALAAAAGDDAELAEESADLLYHLLVLLRARGLPFERIITTLSARHG
jgi:phosphoribosyl-ATP pyrophosphohydrolase/phosphoribosyl-AMP cyclohydrolase